MTSKTSTSRPHGGAERPCFVPADEAEVSIVIPVFEHLDATLACLRAVLENTPTGRYEVIVVDDGSTASVAAELAAIKGIRLIRHDRNEGFLGAVRDGAAVARGAYITFLNNDTQVCTRWLDAVVEAMQRDPRVAAVGSKLIFPDGRLQDAGGIVWSDGTAWNRGRGADADDPLFNVVLDVDYCTAAALTVRRDAFEAVGGFDRRFAPGYYEDADLCFALRSAGWRVVYAPDSIVIHHSGLTFGDDEYNAATGAHSRAAMVRNRYLFVAKWAGELAQHWPCGTARGLRLGRITHQPRVLVCDGEVPRYDHDAGSLRITWIMRLLRELECEVTLFPLHCDRAEPYTSELRQRGIEVYWGPRTFDDLIAERANHFTTVILSRPNVAFELLNRTRLGFPGATVVYDTVDLHHVREQRRYTLHNLPADEDLNHVARRELSLSRRADIVSVVSEEEGRILSASLPTVRTVVLPTVHELPPPSTVPPGQRRGMLFIGGFRHPPNVDGIVWFCQSVLPLIRAQVDIELTILGSRPTAEVLALRACGISVTGYVRDTAPYFDSARCFIAPMRYGAGVKGKVGHALAHGLPVVTTRVGAEGMGIADGVHALVRDRPEHIAAAVVALVRDDDLWEQLSASGRQLIADTLTPGRMLDRLRSLLGFTGFPAFDARADSSSGKSITAMLARTSAGTPH